MVEPPAVGTEVGAKTNSAAPLHQEARNTSSCSVPNPPPTCGVCGMLPQLDVRSASWVVPERSVPKTARPDRPNRTNPSTYPSARSFVADYQPTKSPNTRGSERLLRQRCILCLIRGRARVNLGDTMYERIGVADLGGRILKWAKTDEKL